MQVTDTREEKGDRLDRQVDESGKSYSIVAMVTDRAHCQWQLEYYHLLGVSNFLPNHE